MIYDPMMFNCNQYQIPMDIGADVNVEKLAIKEALYSGDEEKATLLAKQYDKTTYLTYKKISLFITKKDFVSALNLVDQIKLAQKKEFHLNKIFRAALEESQFDICQSVLAQKKSCGNEVYQLFQVYIGIDEHDNAQKLLKDFSLKLWKDPKLNIKRAIKMHLKFNEVETAFCKLKELRIVGQFEEKKVAYQRIQDKCEQIGNDALTSSLEIAIQNLTESTHRLETKARVAAFNIKG